MLQAVFRDILVRIRILEIIPTFDYRTPYLDPTLFISDQTPAKKYFFFYNYISLAYPFLKIYLHHKEVTKQYWYRRNQGLHCFSC
jgi:hypothetical protein